MSKAYSDLRLGVTILFMAICALNTMANGTTLYTTWVPSDDIFAPSVLARIDSDTGEVSAIGSTGAFRLQGLTYDHTSQTLYGTTAPRSGTSLLYRIDPITAESTLVGDTGITNANGLSYDPVRDMLFVTGDGLVAHQLFHLNRSTGIATEVGPGGLSPGTSLAYVGVRDALMFTNAGLEQLLEYDPDTGVQTLIGSTGEYIQGMVYDGSAQMLYGLAGFQNGSAGLGNQLFAIDPDTGDTVQIATLSRTEYYSSLAIIPTPGGAIVLLIPFGVFGVRRRLGVARAECALLQRTACPRCARDRRWHPAHSGRCVWRSSK